MEPEEGELVAFAARVFYYPASDEYAIHEAYFNARDAVVTWTVDALSPRAKSLEALKELIEGLREESANDQELLLGDLRYPYVQVDIEEWLLAFGFPVVDFESGASPLGRG